MKKTAWFDGNVKPVRVGVYEIKGCQFDGDGCGGNFRYWDGYMWSTTRESPREFLVDNATPWYATGQDMTHWRGLASDSKGEK